MTLPLRTERLPRRGRRGRAAVAALLGVSLLGGLAAPADAAPRKKRHAAKTFKVQLLAINDFHGHLEPPPGSSGRITTGYTAPTPTNPTGTPVTVDAGGVEYLATHIRRLKATSRHNVVVAAGDLIGGSPLISAIFHDEPAVEALDKVGLELSSVGNHEFDDGSRELLRMQHGGCHPEDGCQDGDGFRGADFQWLAANVVHDTEDNRARHNHDTLLPPTAIRTFRGVKIGFIGMTLEGTPSIVQPSGILGLDFLDEAETANHWARHLKRQGAEAIVVLLHEGATQTGLYNECKGAGGPLIDIVHRMHDEIDVVVSGHTHRSYICEVDGKLVTSGESFGRLVTDIDLTIDRRTRDVVRARAANVIVTRDVEPTPALTALVAKYKTLSEPLANRVIGQISATISRTENAAGESALGDVIADAQLAATAPADQGGAQIAFMNPGGIRADLPGPPEGDANITYGESFTVQPFGNNLVTMTLTGAQIDQLLEAQWLGQPFQRILQVSAGFSYAWSLSAPAGAKVDPASITLNGVPIDPAGSYRVTVNSFLADGGDNFVVLREGTDRLGGAVDTDALEAYFAAAGGPIAPGPQNRITVLP